MKFLLQSISAGKNRCLIRALSRQYSAVSTGQFEKRNYACNLSEYSTVVNSIIARRRHFLLRDVYDDMMLDGVQPSADFFRSLVVGAMRGARLQDALFFREEMKTMGIAPDVDSYNFLISTCGKCKNVNEAIRVFEDMKRYGVTPNAHTYLCLLNACAAAGRLDHVNAIIRDMTAADVGLNKFCYAGLITAHVNKTPRPADLSTKILEIVEQARGLSSADASKTSAQSMMHGVTVEELYNIPTAELLRRPWFVKCNLVVYHVAFLALADLKDVKAIEALLEMLAQDNHEIDTYTTIQVMRCYLHSGDLDKGLKVFDDYMKSGKTPAFELYTTLIEGAMTGYTEKGMQVAQETLVQMIGHNFFLDPKSGSTLLLKAAGEKTGGYTLANYIWDLMQSRRMMPTLPAIEAYLRGLKEREIPGDDPRLMLVSSAYNNMRRRVGTGSS